MAILTVEQQFSASKLFGVNPLLSEVSPLDADFNLAKRRSLESARLFQVAGLYGTSNQAIFLDWSVRIERCSNSLFFKDTDDGIKLESANFCQVRLCPMCVHRKSKIWIAKAFQSLPLLDSDLRFLFFTLTVKNCQLSKLRESNKALSNAFNNFMASVRFKLKESFLGFVKSYECTSPTSDTAHPHLHLLFAVSEEYFTRRYYLKFDDWLYLWSKAVGAAFNDNYRPSIFVRAIPFDDRHKSFLEILKYELKPEDFCSDWRWFSEFAFQVHGFRKFTTGGVFRQVFGFLEREFTNSQLVHEADRGDCYSHRKYDLSFRWEGNELNQYVLR